MSFGQQNRTILRSMTDNNNADMDDATIEGRVELRTGAPDRKRLS